MKVFMGEVLYISWKSSVKELFLLEVGQNLIKKTFYDIIKSREGE
jgi:hypothetical protein